MGQRTVAVLKLVLNIEIFAWATGLSLQSMEKTGTSLGGRAVSS